MGLWLVLTVVITVSAEQRRLENSTYVVDNWLSSEGVPENSAVAMAQTPEDGYLWIGTYGGLLRFNAREFQPADQLYQMPVLGGAVCCLATDHSGRLWVSTRSGIAVREHGHWRQIPDEGVEGRTMAEDAAGRVLLGTADGRLYRLEYNAATRIGMRLKLAPSGVFLASDAQDGGFWLANRWLVGRFTGTEWRPVGPQPSVQGSLVACRARGGGLWVYFDGQIWRYQADGTTTKVRAPLLDKPVEIFEDHNGMIWLASNSSGLTQLTPAGEVVLTMTVTNGLAHNSARFLFEDAERNLWVGTTSGGLHRLVPRQLTTIGLKEGLPDAAVQTVAEEAPGHLIVGTHGGGTARIVDGQVVWRHPDGAGGPSAHAWSVLADRSGGTWTGTLNNGLFVEREGKEQPVKLDPGIGSTVCALLEDSRGDVWVGGSVGLGRIERGEGRAWPLGPQFTNVNVRQIIEARGAAALWLGTFAHGVLKVSLSRPGVVELVPGLTGERISSLLLDGDGCLWIGVRSKGLAQLKDGKLTRIGPAQGLAARTIGSMIEDGAGGFWLGSNLGILQISSPALHQPAPGRKAGLSFRVFDRSAGLDVPECSDGFQPNVLRDSAGRLWFTTLQGVVAIDPRHLRQNNLPPLAAIERLTFMDAEGIKHASWLEGTAEPALPAGASEIAFQCAILSYTAPANTRFGYCLDHAAPGWVYPGTRAEVNFHSLPPGRHKLQVRAANNDGVWNPVGATLAFQVRPFLWQTAWFRCLVAGGLATGIGGAGWRLARGRYRREVQRLEQQRVLEAERLRLAAVLEATSDLVAFADHGGKLLHLNSAGRRLLGLGPQEDLRTLSLADLHAPSAVEALAGQGIPAARRQGTWEGETALRHRSGREIPVSEVVMALQDGGGQTGFLSTIARDISERKHAEEEKDRLQAQLAQAQKLESVGRLAGGVAHDFNNMLQVILGNVELVLAQLPPYSAFADGLIEIQNAANRSAELTRHLLAFARQQPIQPRVIDLNETVSGMFKMLHRLIGEDIHLTWVPAPGLWPVHIDPSQIDQILANLTVNARDALGEKGCVTIQAANVVVNATEPLPRPDCPPGDYVALTVLDNGKGIAPEVRAHLFEPFFTTKAFGKGTGLGLAIVFGIAKQNGGAITASSEPGQGAVFRVYLPRASAAIDPSPAVVRSRAGAPPGAARTILLVEDQGQVLELTGRILEGAGYRVLASASPRAALDLAARPTAKIDLLITDVVMPEMNGKELRDQVAPLHPGMKCLFMSGYTAEVIADRGVLDRGLHFLQKPFDMDLLLKRVQEVLAPPAGPADV